MTNNLENSNWLIGSEILKRSTRSEVRELIFVMLSSKFEIKEDDEETVKSAIKSFERKCKQKSKNNEDKYAESIRDGVKRALDCMDDKSDCFLDELNDIEADDSDETAV